MQNYNFISYMPRQFGKINGEFGNSSRFMLQNIPLLNKKYRMQSYILINVYIKKILAIPQKLMKSFIEITRNTPSGR